MKPEIIYSAFADKEEKIELNENTVFDRVINLKIKTKPYTPSANNSIEQEKVVDEFLIRSDYEIVYPDQKIGAKKTSKNYKIQKCTIKPSIKVQYNQLTESTQIGVDIFINNFVVMTKDGRNLMTFNQKTYNIDSVEVQMGYLGQFNQALGIRKAEDVGNLSVETLFDFESTSKDISTFKLSEALYVKTDKLPPDYTLHIHGYVGSTTEINKQDTLPDKIDDIKEEVYITSKTKIEDIFFNYVTRRYLNKAKLPAGTKPEYDSENKNLLSSSFAKNYGTKVTLSKKIKGIKFSKQQDSKGNEIDSSFYFSLGGNNNTALSAIQKILENLKLTNVTYNRLGNGDFIVYALDEIQDIKAIKELNKDLKTEVNNGNYASETKGIIPAVYNINIDALATIVCPFFSFLNPFQEIKFASRYALSSQTSFFIGLAPDITSFFVIKVLVSFATVEDVNEMQIVAVADIGGE